jgi:aldose 1-epimerase
MKRILSLLVSSAVLLLALSQPSGADDGLTLGNDADSGFKIYKIAEGDTAIEIVPEAGCNVDSIRYKGTELLKRPKSLKELPGFMYGVPVLYPTPNRVRGGVFTFEGQKFSFPPNDHGNFLHGLVHSAVWEGGDINIGDNNHGGATLAFRLPFASGSEQFKLFPLPHAIQLAIKVGDDSVRWTYTVDNSKGHKPIPFGFAIHPWFLYHGPRKETFVTIPATQVMESTSDNLPTGKLLDLASHPEYDAREPHSLEGFVRDDVYAGIEPSRPAVIDFRDAHLKITLSASEDFKHMVLYTPKDQPWSCVEDQTCSTDAHNLYSQGLKTESNLLIVEPGKTATGWVEFRFANY